MTMSSLMLSQGWLPSLLMVGGVALATMLIVINMRARQARGRAGSMSPREKIEQAKQTHAMRGDLRQMMVELEDLTRRFGAQLDAKSLRIEKLIDQADQRIDRLEQLQQDHPQAPPKSEPAPPVDRKTDDPPVPEDPLAQEIYQLADSGQTSVQIAKRLDEQIGKVELILALRQ